LDGTKNCRPNPKNRILLQRKIRQKITEKCNAIREAVVVIKENTTMQDLHNLSKRLEEELKSEFFKLPFIKMKDIMTKTPKNGNLIITLI
jgi:hypothetical protein